MRRDICAVACVLVLLSNTYAEDADVNVRKGESTDGVVPESPKQVLNAFFKEAGSQVLKLEENNFKMAIDAYYKTIVYFYTPNCRLCVYLAPAFEKAAEVVAARNLPDERQVAFAKVDINAKRVIAEHFEITHVPILLVFNQGDPKGYMRYDSFLGGYNDGARTVSALINYAMRIAGYPLQMAETEEDLIQAKKTWMKYDDDKLVVAFIDEDDKDQKKAVVELGKVAHKARNTSYFLCRNKTIHEKFKIESPAILYLANQEPKRLDFPKGKEMNEENIRKFAERSQVPGKVHTWSGGKGFAERRVWEETWDTHMVFVGPNPEEGVDWREEAGYKAFSEACDAFGEENDKDDILCVHGFAGSRRWELYRGDRDLVPAVSITKQGNRPNSTKVTEVYRLEGEVTKESVTKFRADFLAGKLKSWTLSEPEGTKGATPLAGVEYLVGSSFKSRMAGEFKAKSVLVMISEPGWAGYCETGAGQDCPGDWSKFNANYQSLPDKFSSVKDVVFAQTDPRLNDYATFFPEAELLNYEKVLEKLIAQGPVYLFFPKGAKEKPVQFEGDVTKVEELSKFFADNGVEIGDADTMDEL